MTSRINDFLLYMSNPPYIIFDSDEGVKFAPDKVEDSAPMPKAYEDIREKVEEWLDWSREEDVEAKKKKIFGCVKNIETMMQKRNLVSGFRSTGPKCIVCWSVDLSVCLHL